MIESTRRASIKALFIGLLLSLSAWLTACSNFDEIVKKNETCEQKWADVEATLQRRADLIPNLVETAKAQAKFESSTLEAITKARAEATSIKLSADNLSDPEAMKKFMAAQDNLKGALGRLLVQAENYPQLKGSEGFRALQVQLEGTENRVLRAREEYNKAVAAYNTELGKISGRVVNKATGKEFKPRVYFKSEASAHAAPKVSF